MKWLRLRTASAAVPSEALTRPQLGWLIAASAAAYAPHIGQQPVWLLSACLLLLGLRALLWQQRRPTAPRWLLVALSVAALGAVLIAYRQIFGRAPGVALVALFLALKLNETHSRRDAHVLVQGALFLTFATFLTVQGMATTLLAALSAWISLAALCAATHGTRGVRDNLLRSGRLLLMAIPAMLVLFVLFPRISAPLWGLPLDAHAGRSGLSDSMAPGSIAQLSLSDEIAFRAKFDDAQPAQQDLYWRGPVLSQLEGNRWAISARTRHSFAALPYTPRNAQARYEITLEPHGKNWLFALDYPQSLPEGSTLSADYQLLARKAVIDRRRYAVESAPVPGLGRDEPAAILDETRALPRLGNPRARRFARELAARADTPRALVASVLSNFREQEFTYTLEPPLLGDDAIDEFLFDTRRGFCEHYAAAFVYLMRAAGVPARIVTGYQGGERNPVDGYIVVRQSDAHAWAEVWYADSGWTRIDPTAAIQPSRIERGLAQALPRGEPLPFMLRADFDMLRALRFRWDALANAYNQWVIGYDAVRQRELMARMGMRDADWQKLAFWLVGLGALLLAVYTLWALRQHAPRDPWLIAWRRVTRKLARRGLAQEAWEGPQAYCERVAAARGDLAAAMKQIAALYCAGRYGPAPDNTALTELRRLARHFKP
ncbi:MAG: DUF3488 domain-containing transglutaminase family protein [Rhodocyclaceae bacterium]|nr:DUF3488 domain-containing transglutaminase family protein [Rhodocyclaceae bacterium]MBX3669205.1 DUF3488 domain-containing transglutaminase family protein [Rhodocyclaceae bacterium]